MGQTTANLQIWTPDEGDLDEPDVYLASMAASIENGAGERLLLQEVAIGLKAGLSSTFSLTSSWQIAPVAILSVNGSFAQGITLSGGVATIVTPGMYLISGSMGINNIAGHTAKVELRKNGSGVVSDEQKSDPGFFQVAKQTTIVNCVAGDTLALYVADAAGGGIAQIGPMTHFTVGMIQAVPQ